MANAKTKKKLWLLADGLVVLSVIATVAFVVFVTRSDSQADASACRTPGKQHELTIKNEAFSQTSLTVARCDVVAVTNLDDQPYNLNFGTRDSHQSYAGYKPVTQLRDERIVIDAVQAGSFEIHDHYRDQTVLQLTVRD